MKIFLQFSLFAYFFLLMSVVGWTQPIANANCENSTIWASNLGQDNTPPNLWSDNGVTHYDGCVVVLVL